MSRAAISDNKIQKIISMREQGIDYFTIKAELGVSKFSIWKYSVGIHNGVYDSWLRSQRAVKKSKNINKKSRKII